MEFYKTYNGAAYNTLEPDSVCHAVWVSAVEWGHDGLPPLGHTELPTCPGKFKEFFFIFRILQRFPVILDDLRDELIL